MQKSHKKREQQKIIIIGDSNVGKTSILARYLNDSMGISEPTINIEFAKKDIDIDNRRICQILWDTAGSEKFRSLTKSAMRGSHGVVFVFDVTDVESFNHIQDWLNEVNTVLDLLTVQKVLIGNKKDLERKRKVPYDSAFSMAMTFDMKYHETSAKDSTKEIKKAFVDLSYEIAKNNISDSESSKHRKSQLLNLKREEMRRDSESSCRC